MDRSILVTGGAGFIGSHLVHSLATNNHITVYDSLTTGSRTRVPEEVTFVEADIRDGSTLKQTIAEKDIVFHEAALVSVAESIETPTESHANTVTGTLNVLEAAREHDIKVIIASSAAIYGHPEHTPIDELHPKEPTSPYGLDKLTADHYTRLYHDLYDVDAIPLRYFNVYGPGQTGGDYAGVITIFIEQALNNDPITVQGDGSQTRDFVFVEDVVQANIEGARSEHVGEAYNVGTGESVSIRELAELIQEITDTNADIIHTDPREGDIDHSEADISKIQSKLNYEATVSLREGLERTIEWYRNHK
jgi:UDP-glucose 4-epimerase